MEKVNFKQLVSHISLTTNNDLFTYYIFENRTNEHEDKEIVDVLVRDFPGVYNQILEHLDNI